MTTTDSSTLYPPQIATTDQAAQRPITGGMTTRTAEGEPVQARRTRLIKSGD